MISGLAKRVGAPVGPGAFRLGLAMIVVATHVSPITLGPGAVYVFFVLSGYWLHTMWTRRYVHTHQPYLTYLVSRLWRLAPVMLLVTALSIGFGVAIGVPLHTEFGAGPLRVAFSSTFLLGYAWLRYQPVGPAWSLDVEMQFYLVVPLLAALLLRGFRWPMLAASAIVAVPAAHYIPRGVLPAYAPFFGVGMIAAAADWRPSRALARASGLGVPLLVLVLILSPWRAVVWGAVEPRALHTWNPLLNVALAFAAAPFALHTVRRKSDAADAMLGDLSYIVYLLHWLGVVWLFQRPGGWGAPRLANVAVILPATFVGSWIIWRWFDRPVNRARARWVERRMGARAARAVTLEPALP